MDDGPEPSVLLVDDDEDDRLLGGAALRAAGYRHIVEATRLSQVPHLLRDHRVSIVLLDLRLPDATPRATLAAATDLAKHLPVVVLTGVDDDDLAAQALSLGAQDYLAKADLTPQLLRRTLRHATDRHGFTTERARLLEELAERDRGFRILAEESTDAVLRVAHRDTGPWVTYTNPAWTRLAGDDGLGDATRVLARFAKEEQEDLVTAILTRRSTDGTIRTRLQGAEGWRIVEVHARLVAASERRVAESLVTVRDVTLQHEQEQSLRSALQHERRASLENAELARLRSALLQAGSHRFRTPLTVVIGLAKTLVTRPELAQPEMVRNLAGRIVDQASRLHANLEDLMLLSDDYTTADPGRPRPLQEVVDESLTANPVAPRRLEVDVSGSDLEVPSGLLRRMLGHLLANAAQHTPPTTVVQVAVTASDDTVSLRVADDGPGLPTTHQTGVLRLGHDSAADPGLGLGLAVVQQLTVQHGGICIIGAEDDRPGLTVTVHLPRRSILEASGDIWPPEGATVVPRTLRPVGAASAIPTPVVADRVAPT